MQDDLSPLTDKVLATFGQPFTLVRTDSPPDTITGILQQTLQPVGTLDMAMQSLTTLSLSRTVELKRGDIITALTGEWKGEWRVDRRLHDDGYLMKWNLHAT